MEPAITPIGDRVLVKPMEVSGTAAAGIQLLEGSKELPQEGVVVALPSAPLDGLPDPNHFLEVGDRIVFDRYAGDDVKMRGPDGTEEKFKMLLLESIYAIISPIPV